ncbi:MAG: DUF1330 domain-containing protein [Pseudomonadota bacterium]
MAKGYWIARMDVRDPEAYKGYVEGARSAFQRHNAKFIVRGGAVTELEGGSRSRNVVIEFPSVDAAIACYKDPDYQEAMKIRQAHADGELIIVEGFDG